MNGRRSMRIWNLGVRWTLIVAIGLMAIARNALAADRPNIVILMTDDTG